MESEVKHKVLIFLWQWWMTRNKTNEGTEICSSVAFHQNGARKDSKLDHINKIKTSTPNGSHHRLTITRLIFDASFYQNSGSGDGVLL